MTPYSFSDVNEPLIGSATSAEDIVSALAGRGCLDLTSSINWTACSEFPLAGGGLCDVFRGELNVGTNVAIKSLRVYDESGDRVKVLKRAARELYYWSKLKHRNVLPLMGLAMFRGQICMISKWMENGSLATYIRLHPDVDRRRLCMDLCEGLSYIHANGMVHGDLKAVNVMISSEGSAMIADFGNAELKDCTLKFTNTTRRGFSVRWAAPELLNEDDGPQMSKEADVYAYGMTVLEALTGKVPFDGTSEHRVLCLVALGQGIPPRPDTDVCDGLWAILNSCWDREPSRRPSIMSVGTRLQALFAGPRPCQREPGRSSSLTLDVPQVALDQAHLLKRHAPTSIVTRSSNNQHSLLLPEKPPTDSLAASNTTSPASVMNTTKTVNEPSVPPPPPPPPGRSMSLIESVTIKNTMAWLKTLSPRACYYHYLTKRGCTTENCSYGHDHVFSPEMLADFREFVKKQYPCYFVKYGTECKDVECPSAHRCPQGPKCTWHKQGTCIFTGSGMHDVPVSPEDNQDYVSSPNGRKRTRLSRHSTSYDGPAGQGS